RIRTGDRADRAAGLPRRACLGTASPVGPEAARGRAAGRDGGAAIARDVPAVVRLRTARPAPYGLRPAARPPGHARADQPGRDQVRGRTAAPRALAGRRPAAVLRIEPGLAAVVPGASRGAACRGRRRRAGAAHGARGDRLAGLTAPGTHLGTALPD